MAVSLSVFTDCILIWKAQWLEKERDDFVTDTQTDSAPVWKRYLNAMNATWNRFET